jgi:hypothetical protein
MVGCDERFDRRATRREAARAVLRGVAGLALVGLLGGCGDSDGSSDGLDDGDLSDAELEAEEARALERAEADAAALLDDVRRVGLAYGLFWAEHGDDRGPQSLDDLRPFLTTDPRAAEDVARGRIVVVWGLALARLPRGASGTVLAYAADAPERGGPAAFADTSARRVAADELARALRR